MIFRSTAKMSDDGRNEEQNMPVPSGYAIRGGAEGRERMRILARVMHASTSSLFERLSVCGRLMCLDVGCGGGDVTIELARRVGPHGQAIGVDLDETKVNLARQESAEQGISNVEFRVHDIRTP